MRLPYAGTDVCEASLYKYICQSIHTNAVMQNYADTVLTDAYLKVQSAVLVQGKIFLHLHWRPER